MIYIPIKVQPPYKPDDEFFWEKHPHAREAEIRKCFKYVQARDLQGSWKVLDMIDPSQAAALAVLANRLEEEIEKRSQRRLQDLRAAAKTLPKKS